MFPHISSVGSDDSDSSTSSDDSGAPRRDGMHVTWNNYSHPTIKCVM